ncbi:hypothetical protein SERLA73DRAFT_107710 [Serpula lacrymans var. lacrymans S7.3]|uniref:RNA helicase n=1 Tax=Serpula lacrymans var. lacrymans (strain S7.3) TaxID=936435 RepID=F8PXM6_SERL3|nr:hypothetical protein SERLA73DRAFT_107710 [Serpula lacrymans var. lacrymans S7.3]
MPKKKRTQLKPVARGFATTSVPKKVVQVEQEVNLGDISSAGEDQNQTQEQVSASAGQDESLLTPKDVIEAQKLQEQVLQDVVDKHQEKTEREIIRTVKAIRVDRRFSKTLPSLDLDAVLVDRILELTSEVDDNEVGRDFLDENEEKAVSRLAVTYGVLRRLGFSETRVDECIRSIHGVDLDEAYDWLYAHCPEEELGEQGIIDGFRTLRPSHSTRAISGVEINAMPKSSLPNNTPSVPKASTGLNAQAPAFIPSSRSTLLDPIIWNPDTPNSEPTGIYVSADDDAQPKEHLEEVPPKRICEDNNADISKPEQAPLSHVDVVNDVLDEDSDDAVGGIFELFEEMSNETTEKGVTIKVRDMALPKNWSGRTPKILLSETVMKIDRYAAVTYQLISGSSRAKRSSVKVLWEGGRADEWAMEDIACHNSAQSEQYIATVALHALTFPEADGFAAGTLNAPGGQTFFRLFPAIFRDLWDELEQARKDRSDAINRSIWARLKSIVGKKFDSNTKSNDKSAKKTGNLVIGPTARHYHASYNATSDQLVAEFEARQGSTAYQAMLSHRNQLPIAKYREEITSALEYSQVLVLSGETGCGKSTQVPAFILEDQLSQGKPCKIYCTEPRRISALSLAQRVSLELGDAPGAVGTMSSLVGYSIRLESNTCRNTRLAFVTNGIALRMLESGSGQGGQGMAFDEITHLIIDEVHERTIESDFLLIVLKSLLAQKSDLKIILMSATMDVEKISKFFGGCPSFQIPGRTFPVDVRYLEDAVEHTKWTITENSPYARRPYDKFYRNKNGTNRSEDKDIADGDDDDDNDTTQGNFKLEKRYSSQTIATMNLFDERLIPYDLIIRLLERLCFEDDALHPFSSAVLVFMPGLGEIRRLNDLLSEHRLFGDDSSFTIYHLHSTLSSESQNRVFEIPPPGVRKIVIATNIAETGITIPDITCVIDTGKHREMRFDEKRQISRLVETFVAKSNAAQRRGRAGRVQSGLCYHLFTKTRHDTQLAENPLPEMMRLSLSDLALRIKIMKVNLGSSIEEVLSQAMDPPVSVNVQRAISALVEVRALTPSEDITPMGRLLSKLPTEVHLGKFLLTAALFRCLDPALTIAAALNSKSPFVTPFGMEQEADIAKKTFRTENSDFLTIHNAFASWRRASSNAGFVHKFCRTHFLSHQNLQQIEELRQQFLGYLVDSSFIEVDKSFVRELSRARYGRNRPRFVTVPPSLDSNSYNTALVNAALAAGLYPKILTVDSTGQMKTISNNQPSAFHPSSINFGKKATDFGVNYLSYFTLMHSRKLYAWETGPVDDISLLLLCGECDFRLISDSASVDRKIRFHIPPKSNVALKLLRNHLSDILARQLRGKPLTECQKSWYELALIVLGKMKSQIHTIEDAPSLIVS